MRDMVESEGTSPPLDERLDQAREWLERQYSDVGDNWFPITGDASFRRYFRVRVEGHSRIVMDAPPDKEHSTAFVDIDSRLRKTGLHAPEIFNHDLEAGFILLEDFGDDLYRDIVTAQNFKPFFDEALTALAVMARDVDPTGLPRYGEDLLHTELNWYVDLYLGRHLHYTLAHTQRKQWMDFCGELVHAALELPQVFVHKDIHSSNLMQTQSNSPGILDFQDALLGPVSYDFISLIWDRYISWPRPMLEQWMEQYRLLVEPGMDPKKWIYYCDLMGLQRNIKIVGRFALLYHKHAKPGYIEMIPRFHQYILDVLPRYPKFAQVFEWIGSDACAP